MNSTREINRLSNGPKLGEQPDGLLVDFIAEGENAVVILEAAREVWGAVIKQHDPASLTLDKWHQILPDWFIRKCSPEISREEAIRRRSLPMDERLKLAENWSLGAWVYWLKPSERQWEWWDAKVLSPRSLRVIVLAKGCPFPAGSLEWLLKCSGARSVEGP